jgi:hypothetical protein
MRLPDGSNVTPVSSEARVEGADCREELRHSAVAPMNSRRVPAIGHKCGWYVGGLVKDV